MLAGIGAKPLKGSSRRPATLRRSGEIIQAKTYAVDPGTLTGSGAYVTINAVAAWPFTPRSTNSTILVQVSGEFGVYPQGAGEYYCLYRIADTTTGTGSAGVQYRGQFTGAGQMSVPGILRWAIANASLAARSFVTQLATTASSAPGGGSGGGLNLLCTIIEIQN